MKNYISLLKNNLKKNYKNSTIFDKDLIKLHQLFIKQNLKKIKKKESKKDLVKKGDYTFKKISKLYLSTTLKKKEKQILIFHKKFEVNLSLKKKYSKNYFKLSNLETSIPTYCYLGLIINQSKNLNKYQKINTILKIIDKITVTEKNIFYCKRKFFEKLIKVEDKLLTGIINAK